MTDISQQELLAEVNLDKNTVRDAVPKKILVTCRCFRAQAMVRSLPSQFNVYHQIGCNGGVYLFGPGNQMGLSAPQYVSLRHALISSMGLNNSEETQEIAFLVHDLCEQSPVSMSLSHAQRREAHLGFLHSALLAINGYIQPIMASSPHKKSPTISFLWASWEDNEDAVMKLAELPVDIKRQKSKSA